MKKIAAYLALQLTGNRLTKLLQIFKVLSVPGSMDNVTRSTTEEPPPAKRLCLQEETSISEETNETTRDGPRFPKRRKTILLMSYSGKGYMGMQKNPGVRTIEEDLLEALSNAGAFPPEMKNDLGKLHFQRCARTDKGVSAARQVVSLKSLVPVINTHLPAQIRVFALKQVTRSFDSRHNCSGRSYEYLLPTYAFAPYRLTTLDFKIDDDTVAQVNKLLQYYVGTHNFHNFTSGKKFEDASSKRYIVSFESGERFLAKASCNTCKEGKEVEFLPLRVRGQSFMIHQIRKMVGLVIAIVRGHTPEDTILRAYQKGKVDIPRAPALGLLLDNVHFDGYNRRFASDGTREPLEWIEYKEDIEQFKREHIHQTIVDTEVNELSMMQWLGSLKIHDFTSTSRRLQEENANTSVTTQSKEKESNDSKSEVNSSADIVKDIGGSPNDKTGVNSDVTTGPADSTTVVASNSSESGAVVNNEQHGAEQLENSNQINSDKIGSVV